jgi:hypothetical protein
VKQERIQAYLEKKSLAKDLYNNTDLSASQVAVQLRISYATVLKMLANKDPKYITKYLEENEGDEESVPRLYSTN